MLFCILSISALCSISRTEALPTDQGGGLLTLAYSAEFVGAEDCVDSPIVSLSSSGVAKVELVANLLRPSVVSFEPTLICSACSSDELSLELTRSGIDECVEGVPPFVSSLGC